jgi:hypothetical protein
VRCFVPYRPSRDVDLGVASEQSLDDLLRHLAAVGTLRIDERSADTAHVRWNGTRVSVFVVPFLQEHVVGRCLDRTAVLATKLQAILDRGTRRDFVDLFVMLQDQRLGLVDGLAAMRDVYGQQVSEPLLLRGLTYFDDAEREPPLSGEGPDDWRTVVEFFLDAVGSLVVPPGAALKIQERRVDVSERRRGPSGTSSGGQ